MKFRRSNMQPFLLTNQLTTNLYALGLLVVSILSCGFGYGQTTIYSENFNGYSNVILSTSTTSWRSIYLTPSVSTWAIWDVSSPLDIPTRALEMYYTTVDLRYKNNDDCNVIAYENTAINASTYNNLTLSFDWKAGGEGGSNVDDYLIPVYSTDGGTTWNDVGTQLANYANYSTAASFASVTNLSLSACDGTSFKIGFRWVNDASLGDEKGAVVDNIVIKGTACTSPTTYTVNGGGTACANIGAIVGLNSSQNGVSYQLKINGVATGAPISGTGSAINFPAQTTAGIYTVSASGTGYCPKNMSGSSTITINPIPTSVTAGSSPATFCSGGSAALAGSAIGVNSTGSLLSENFASGSLPSGWSRPNGGWATNSSSNAGGSSPEMASNTYGATWSLNTSVINATSKTGLSLSFKYMADWYSNSLTFRVETSPNGSTWTSRWSNTITADVAANTQTVNLSALDNSTFYIRFVLVSGSSMYLNNLYLDDINLTYATLLPVTYTWSGGTFVSGQNTANPTVNPSSTTTYTMTATSGGCSVSSTVAVNVTPIAGGTASANQTICVGSIPASLSLTGNSGTIQWQESGDNSTFTNILGQTAATLTGSTIGALNATKYFRANVTNGSCNAQSNVVTITTPTIGTNLGNNGDQATCRVKNGNWIHFYNGGKLLVSISSVDDLGDVEVTSFVGSPLEVQACGTTDPMYATSVLGRHWVIERDATSFPISNPILVRLPFDQSEVDALYSLANSNQNPVDDISLANLSNIKLSKYSGPNNVDADPANNCPSAGGTGGTTLISQSGSGEISSYAAGFPSSGKYLEFSVSGFSEFWLHGSSNVSPLPIEFLDASISCDDNRNKTISWRTATEKNVDYFEIQKSLDLEHWTKIGTISAVGNATTLTEYSFTDVEKNAGLSYYQLIVNDLDGKHEAIGPWSSACELENELLVFPNPSNGKVTVQLTSTTNGSDLALTITDSKGACVYVRSLKLQHGTTTIQLNTDELQSGIYFIHLSGQNQSFKPVKLLVN